MFCEDRTSLDSLYSFRLTRSGRSVTHKIVFCSLERLLRDALDLLRGNH